MTGLCRSMNQGWAQDAPVDGDAALREGPRLMPVSWIIVPGVCGVLVSNVGVHETCQTLIMARRP